MVTEGVISGGDTDVTEGGGARIAALARAQLSGSDLSACPSLSHTVRAADKAGWAGHQPRHRSPGRDGWLGQLSQSQTDEVCYRGFTADRSAGRREESQRNSPSQSGELTWKSENGHRLRVNDITFRPDSSDDTLK